MSDPRFSIIIPTFDCHDTLIKTIETCTAQEFKDFEVIVCHDLSNPDVRAMVEAFEDERVKFVGSDKRMVMSDNWELAVSHAKGEYLIIVGDDDGLMLHALKELDRILNELNVKVVRWDRVYYNWPCLIIKELANEMQIPLEKKSIFVNAKKIIPKIANLKTSYTMLPMLYNSAIHRDLVKELIEKTGRVFKAYNADIYSGFAFAHLAGIYVSLGRPMSINAGAAHSIGTLRNVSRTTEFEKEDNDRRIKAGLPPHPRVARLYTVKDAIADSFEYFKDELKPSGSKMVLDRKNFINRAIRQNKARGLMNWELDYKKIYDSLEDDKSLQKWFTSNFSADKEPVSRKTKPRVKGKSNLGFHGKEFLIDASHFGVKDVMEAAVLCENLFSYKLNPLKWPDSKMDKLKKRVDRTLSKIKR